MRLLTIILVALAFGWLLDVVSAIAERIHKRSNKNAE